MFGAGLPTPPECVNVRRGSPDPAGVACSARVSRPRRSARPKVSRAHRRPWLSWAFLLSEHTLKRRRPSVRHSCGVRRPAHNMRPSVWHSCGVRYPRNEHQWHGLPARVHSGHGQDGRASVTAGDLRSGTRAGQETRAQHEFIAGQDGDDLYLLCTLSSVFLRSPNRGVVRPFQFAPRADGSLSR